MLVSEYDRFVQNSDQSAGRPQEDRLDIATYGLAAEIGSVVAAVKKRLLAEDGAGAWNVANEEIAEELGDVVWYCFSIARVANPDKPVNIFAHDIANLRREIGAGDEHADRIRGVLDPVKHGEFLRAAEKFPKRTKVMEFEDYQSVAFLTARTADRTLAEVCLAVLWQLSAQLFRRKLPSIELELNKAMADKPINDVLGEIAWHVSALASIYDLKLSDIAQRNMDKVSYRLDRGHPTPLHDETYPQSEQMPRYFEVAFVTVAKRRSRMYLDGRRLGDDLTDNAYDDDGYRFHDIMHLANAAKLGWSPVLRGLMGRKRRSNSITDEVEDGARAKIVEEAIIKAIHSEGERLATLQGRRAAGGPSRLFSNRADVTFRFLKFINTLAAGLEVANNRYWEWEDAIIEGHEIFHRLRCEGQGTIVVDLESRSIMFKPEVCIPLSGRVGGLGSAAIRQNTPGADKKAVGHANEVVSDPANESASDRAMIQKLAILRALGFQGPVEQDLAELQITEVGNGGISVKAAGRIRQAMWDRNVVAFRTTIVPTGDGQMHCTAIAVTDE